MTCVLHVQSSSNLRDATTRQIGTLAIEQLKTHDPEAVVIERDLIKSPVPHLSPQFLEALFSGNDADNDLSLSDQLIDEVLSSDILVIEAPMYNFGIPSVLKAWVDHIVRARKTFNYTEYGPTGLLSGKGALLILSSGGIYSVGPMEAFDHQGSYLKHILEFIGISDIETIRLEGMALGKEQTALSLSSAHEKLTGSLKSLLGADRKPLLEEAKWHTKGSEGEVVRLCHCKRASCFKKTTRSDYDLISLDTEDEHAI